MSKEKPSIAVILSGCGNRDGSEIHEATLTLWAIHRHGSDYQCYAPDKKQHHVLNHLNGKEMPEERNVLIESARIAGEKSRISPSLTRRPMTFSSSRAVSARPRTSQLMPSTAPSARLTRLSPRL